MAGAFQEMTASLYRRIEASEHFARRRPRAQEPAHRRALDRRIAGLCQDRRAARSARAADPGGAEAPQPAHHRRLQRLPPRRRAGAQGDASHRRDDDAAQRRRHLPRHPGRRHPPHRARDRAAQFAAGAYVVVGHEGAARAACITNLLDNAISFSPENGGVVTVRARRVGTVRSRSWSRTRDPASPPTGSTTIFDRFYSDRPATDRAAARILGWA